MERQGRGRETETERREDRRIEDRGQDIITVTEETLTVATTRNQDEDLVILLIKITPQSSLITPQALRGRRGNTGNTVQGPCLDRVQDLVPVPDRDSRKVESEGNMNIKQPLRADPIVSQVKFVDAFSRNSL